MKAVSDVVAPISGTIIETNDAVVDAPELINGSPYEDGWLVKVKVADLAELDALLSAEEYDQLLAGTE